MLAVKARGDLWVGAVVFAVLLVWVGNVAHANPAGALTVGTLAPHFAAPGLDGHVHALETYRGRPVILNFWATWCVPCREEMPLLQTAYERYKENALAVLAISQDTKGSQKTVREYVANAALTFQVLLDPDGTVAGQYHVLLLPSTVFVNAQGVITGIHHGLVTAKQLEQYLTALLSP